MKRLPYYSMVVIAVIAITAFNAGNAKSSDRSQTVSAPETEKTTVTLAHWSASSAGVIDRVVSEYNKSNKDGILIEIINIPSDNVDVTVNLMMTSGLAPDIFCMDTGKVELFASKRWIADLTSYAGNDFLNRFPDYAVKSAKSYTKDGKIYTIASIADTYRLIYNRDLFEKAGLDPDKPPTTLVETREYAKRIRDAFKNGGIYGFALPAAEDWPSFNLAMEYPASLSGLTYFNYSQGKYDLTVFGPWLQFFMDMKQDGSLFSGDLYLKNDTARRQFAEGNVGMMFAGSWDPSVFDTQFPAKCNWDVAMPPALNDEHAGTGALTMQQGWSWAISARTQHLDKAAIVWKYLYSEDFLGELFHNGCVLPIVKGITDNLKYKPAVKNFNKFFPTDDESAYPVTPFFIDENVRWKYYRDALTGKKSIAESLQEGSDYLNAMLKLAEKEKGMDIGEYTYAGYDPLHPMSR